MARECNDCGQLPEIMCAEEEKFVDGILTKTATFCAFLLS